MNVRILSSRHTGYHTCRRSRCESLPIRALEEEVWWQKYRCTPIHWHQTVSGVDSLYTVNGSSNIPASDAMPFAVEPFSKGSLRHRPSLGTVANEYSIWQVQSVPFLQSQGRAWELNIKRSFKSGCISRRTNFGMNMKARSLPLTDLNGISARYVNDPPRGEGSQDRNLTPGLALDYGNLNCFRGSGIIPGSRLSIWLGVRATAECNLRATKNWELFMLINNPVHFCLLMVEA